MFPHLSISISSSLHQHHPEHAKLTHEAYSAVPVSTVDNIATNDIAYDSLLPILAVFRLQPNNPTNYRNSFLTPPTILDVHERHIHFTNFLFTFALHIVSLTSPLPPHPNHTTYSTASHNVLIELFKVVQNAASSVEATKCGVEALGSALVALAAQLTAQSAPWKDAQWTETKSTTYALRGAVPMVVTCLQHLTSARSLKERIAGGALPGALTTFTDALKITAEHAKALSAHIKPLNDNAQILREVSACAAEQWQGSDAAVGAFAGKVQASWLAALKRYGDTFPFYATPKTNIKYPQNCN